MTESKIPIQLEINTELILRSNDLMNVQWSWNGSHWKRLVCTNDFITCRLYGRTKNQSCLMIWRNRKRKNDFVCRFHSSWGSPDSHSISLYARRRLCKSIVLSQLQIRDDTDQSHPFSLIMWANSMMYLPSLYFWLVSKACSC